MIIIYILLSVLSILLFVNIFLTTKAVKNETSRDLAGIKSSIETLISNLKDFEKNLKDEFISNRRESAETATGLRIEIGDQLNKFTQTISDQLGNHTKSNEEKLEAIRKTL